MGAPFAGSPRDWHARQDAAVQRVATLVAREPPMDEVFAVVTREAGMLLGARMTVLLRVESADEAAVVAEWSSDDTHLAVGSRGALDGRGLVGRVLRTGQQVRVEAFDEVGGAVAEEMRRLGIPSAVAGPIVVDGRIWGALSAAWAEGASLPAGAEDRIAAFAELTSYAIVNAERRDDLVASRARLVEAADEEHRRAARDLHDGVEDTLARVVATLAGAAARADVPPELRRLLAQGLDDARAAAEALRAVARGLHPRLLDERGLAAAVRALADGAPVPVDVDIPDARHPAFAEAAAYAVAAEGLANATRHTRAPAVRIHATATADRLVLSVEDDGAGGATPAPGNGLARLADRVAAFGGTLTVDSPPGEGTRLRAAIPLEAPVARVSDRHL